MRIFELNNYYIERYNIDKESVRKRVFYIYENHQYYEKILKGVQNRNAVIQTMKARIIIEILQDSHEVINDSYLALNTRFQNLKEEERYHGKTEGHWIELEDYKSNMRKLKFKAVAQLLLILDEIHSSGELDKYLDRFPK